MSSSMSSKRLRLGSGADDQFASTSDTSARKNSADSNKKRTMQEEARSNDLILGLQKDVIRIESHPCPNGCKVKVVLTPANANAATHYQLSWADATKYVQEASVDKTYVHLILGGRDGDIDNALREEFLPKCGHLVSRLDVAGPAFFGIGFSKDFFKVLHANFPNVNHISLNGDFSLLNHYDTEEEIEAKHSTGLQTIDFGVNTIFPHDFVPRLLKYASKLEHSLNFPLNNVGTPAFAAKSSTVRTVVLSQPYRTRRKHVENGVISLASSETRITDFNWKQIAGYGSITSPEIQSSLQKIFESSKDTMKSLVGPVLISKHVKIPIMSALEHLIFDQPYLSTEELKEYPLLQVGANLEEMFPNVKTVTISCCVETEESVNENFPREVFERFGSGIKSLTLSPLTVDTNRITGRCIAELFVLFPFVTSLSLVWVRRMHNVLGRIYKNWEGLKVLTLTVDHFNVFHNKFIIKDHNGIRPEFFDGAVTGDNSGSLSKLKHLEKLNVIITDKKLSAKGKGQNFITSRTIEYLKEFLPDVKVFIGITRDCVNVKDLLELLEPVLPHVEFDPCYDV